MTDQTSTEWVPGEALRHYLNRSAEYVKARSDFEIHDLDEMCWIEEAIIMADPETAASYQQLPFVGRILAIRKIQERMTQQLLWGDGAKLNWSANTEARAELGGIESPWADPDALPSVRDIASWIPVHRDMFDAADLSRPDRGVELPEVKLSHIWAGSFDPAPISQEAVVAGRNRELADKLEVTKDLIRRFGEVRPTTIEVTGADINAFGASQRGWSRPVKEHIPGGDGRPNRHDRRRLRALGNRRR